MKLKILQLLFLILIITSCDKDPKSTSSFKLDINDLKGDINDGIVVLKSDQIYKLTGPLNVNAGAELRIECGVKIIAQSALEVDSLYININQGAKINAVGTATCPIIFTSTDTISGSWGGLIIHGKALNNKGINSSSIINYPYGGNDPLDNSGILKYIIIKNSGALLPNSSHFPGLSLLSVGSKTVVEYIAIQNAASDGLYYSGGSVNCNNIFCENIKDDGLDCLNGYTGSINYVYLKTTFSQMSSDSRGIEIDNNSVDFNANPLTKPNINNVSIIGRGSNIGGFSANQGIIIRKGAGGIFKNIFIQGHPVGVMINDNASIDKIALNQLKLINVQFSDVPSTNKIIGKINSSSLIDVSNALTEGISNGAGDFSSKPSWANFVR